MIDLPAEIRSQILHDLLVHFPRTYELRRSRSSGIRLKIAGESDVEVSNRGFSGLSSQVALVDRQICAEALPILYGMNAFNMESSGRHTDHDSKRASRLFLDRIGKRNVALMSHIDVLDYGSFTHVHHIFQRVQETSFLGLLVNHPGLANLESVRLLIRDVYSVDAFPVIKELPASIEDAETEAELRQFSEAYHRRFLLHVRSAFSNLGLDLNYWYEMKERYHVEPILYGCRYPLKEHTNLLQSADPVSI